MTAGVWNIIGLVLVFAGVVLLFIFGMPFRVRRGGRGSWLRVGIDEADLREERIFNAMGWIGLILVLLGTLSQIMANMM
jgi:hypothetical protein